MSKTSIFSAHAHLPTGSDIYENHKYITVIMEVDVTNGDVLACSVPIYCTENSNFVSEIITGRNLERDLESIIEEIEERMHVLSKWALITAIKTLQNKYLAVRQKDRVL